MIPTALIPAGAVAKGPFEAGVLQVVARHRDVFPVRTVVGASAGALSAIVYAAGIRAGREGEAAETITTLWRDHGGWLDVFRPSLREIVRLRGLGTANVAFPMLQGAVLTWSQQPAVSDVDLRLVLTTLRGRDGKIGHRAATTYECAKAFAAVDFERAANRDRICRTAMGSAAFPGVFAPVDVPDVGPCVDGGSVDNTPIKWAIEAGAQRVIVVTTTPIRVAHEEPIQGLRLLNEFADLLINERLYRDLRDAESANEALRKLDKLAKDGTLTYAQRAAVDAALGWKLIEVIQVRPDRELRGNAFSGFGSKRLRAEYIAAGREAAEKALGPYARGATTTTPTAESIPA